MVDNSSGMNEGMKRERERDGMIDRWMRNKGGFGCCIYRAFSRVNWAFGGCNIIAQRSKQTITQLRRHEEGNPNSI